MMLLQFSWITLQHWRIIIAGGSLLKRFISSYKNINCISRSMQDKIEMEQFMTTSISDYVEAMRLDGTYADHVCLQAMCDMLNINIHIVHATNCDVILKPRVPSMTQVVLGYLSDIQHYVSLESSMRIGVDDFVAVLLKQRKKKKIYTGKILQLDNEEVKVRYLQSSRPEGIYTWPARDDISWQPRTDVIQKLQPPQLVPGRGLKLKFNLNEIRLCQEKTFELVITD